MLGVPCSMRDPAPPAATQYTGGHRRWTKPLTRESASRPRWRRAMWKNPVLCSSPPSPRFPAPESRSTENPPRSGFSTVVERSCGIGMVSAYPEHAARDAWSTVLTRAREELPETTLVMWFSDVRPAALDANVLALAVPSPLVRERLQHNHLSLIEDAAAAACGRPVKIEFEVEESLRHILDESPAPRVSEGFPAPTLTTDAAPVTTRAPVSLGAPGLPFPNYTFDAFVPG